MLFSKLYGFGRPWPFIMSFIPLHLDAAPLSLKTSLHLSMHHLHDSICSAFGTSLLPSPSRTHSGRVLVTRRCLKRGSRNVLFDSYLICVPCIEGPWGQNPWYLSRHIHYQTRRPIPVLRNQVHRRFLAAAHPHRQIKYTIVPRPPGASTPPKRTL